MSAHHAPSITVLYFAGASTATGLTTEDVELPVPANDEGRETSFPLSRLAELLTARHPNTTLGEVLEKSSWAVDAEMVEDPAQVVLRGGEEVAVICPVSGG